MKGFLGLQNLAQMESYSLLGFPSLPLRKVGRLFFNLSKNCRLICRSIQVLWVNQFRLQQRLKVLLFRHRVDVWTSTLTECVGFWLKKTVI
ncbi:hypothetical protein LINPERHAP2_LOCUS27426 [Linum perenne]